MDETALTKLSADHLAALDEAEKEIFCAMHPSDQDFAARYISPASLPGFLQKKNSSMEWHKKRQAREEAIAELMRNTAIVPAAESRGANIGEAVVGGAAAVTAAVGIGVLAGRVSTDGTMVWHDLPIPLAIQTLRGEFDRGDGRTATGVSTLDGKTQRVDIFLVASGKRVPGISIQLANLDQGGTHVSVSDLTNASINATLKERGADALDLLKDGAGVLLRRRALGQIDLGRIFGLGKEAFDKLLDAQQSVKDLNLEDRAWKCLLAVGDPREKAWEKRQYAAAIEKENQRLAWKYYDDCERCGVPYPPEAQTCTVCENTRPEQPKFPRPAN